MQITLHMNFKVLFGPGVPVLGTVSVQVMGDGKSASYTLSWVEGRYMYGHACNQITAHDYNVGGTRNSSSGPGGNLASILSGIGRVHVTKAAWSQAVITLIFSMCHPTKVCYWLPSQYPPGNTDLHAALFKVWYCCCLSTPRGWWHFCIHVVPASLIAAVLTIGGPASSISPFAA